MQAIIASDVVDGSRDSLYVIGGGHGIGDVRDQNRVLLFWEKEIISRKR